MLCVNMTFWTLFSAPIRQVVFVQGFLYSLGNQRVYLMNGAEFFFAKNSKKADNMLHTLENLPQCETIFCSLMLFCIPLGFFKIKRWGSEDRESKKPGESKWEV